MSSALSAIFTLAPHLNAQNDAAELKLWAERRMGELVAETVPHRGGKGSIGSRDGTQLPDGRGRSRGVRQQGAAG